MCTQRSPYNWSEQLYVRHGESIAGYLRQTVLAELRSKHKDSQLSELAARWSNHRIMNKWMTRFFMYLDRYYVKHHSLPTLDAAGLKHFKEIVYDEVKRDCMTSMITLVDEERDGGTIDADLIKKCVELFEAMGMGTLDAYTADFEEHLLEATKEYYARKSELWIAHDDTPSYMLKAEEALQQEKERVQKYFNSSSEPKLLRVVEQEILEKRETVLLEKEGSGCKVLLQNDKVEDLSRMFRLFSRIPEKGLPPIAAIVKAHIEDAGGDVLDKRQAKIEAGEKDTNSDPTFIKDLLALHDKYTSLVNDQFGNNSLFQKALKEAFVDFVNRDVGKHTNADLMSSFCDRILKTGGEKLSDEDIEAYLEKTVKLFSYLTDKDLFSEIYRNQLAKRLLNQRSASDDAERIMIGKLRLLCGSRSTGQMEGMLNDLNIGVDHQTDFASHVKDKGVDVGKIDFSVQVRGERAAAAAAAAAAAVFFSGADCWGRAYSCPTCCCCRCCCCHRPHLASLRY
jgi:cullin 1